MLPPRPPVPPRARRLRRIARGRSESHEGSVQARDGAQRPRAVPRRHQDHQDFTREGTGRSRRRQRPGGVRAPPVAGVRGRFPHARPPLRQARDVLSKVRGLRRAG